MMTNLSNGRFLRNIPKKLIKKSLGLFGLEIQRQHIIPRTSMLGCLQQASKNGLQPKTIIDVGAARGTPALYEVFPTARHILIEPLQEFAPYLDQLVGNLEQAEYIVAAAAKTSGNTVINVHPDLVGSSLYLEEENSDVNGIERIVPAITLDEFCQNTKTQGPYLIKIDTQGAELDVLMGAKTVLPETAFVILEVSFFEFFRGGPQIYDCIVFMKEHGFVAYDIFGFQYRPSDGAMSQVDIAFVEEKGPFRQHHYYATPDQRAAQNKRLRA
jgi:FkbM family methyltransferase